MRKNVGSGWMVCHPTAPYQAGEDCGGVVSNHVSKRVLGEARDLERLGSPASTFALFNFYLGKPKRFRSEVKDGIVTILEFFRS